MKRIVYLLLILLPAVSRAQDKPLYLDTKQPLEKRARDLMSRMTLEEKATFLNHRGGDVPRFNILADRWNQALHGIWWNRPTTMFPTPIAMGATWDPKLIFETATAISDEGRAVYNGWHLDPNAPGEHKGLIYRSPVINISRNPYWGRINETYSEDPYLMGRLAVAFVKGLQGDDPNHLKLASTLKHFAVNNVEQGRQQLSATVSERMLHEFWLPHFKDAIVEGGARSIMASYNSINGVHNNVNSLLLTDILKKQWGFTGFVVSDLGGVASMLRGEQTVKMTVEEAVSKSVLAGCDFSDAEFAQYIPGAVKGGFLPMEKLDEAVYRVMLVRFQLGEFDPFESGKYSKIPVSVIGNAEHKALALKVAQKSMVLLSNKNHLLPLDKNKVKTIAVIGPHAEVFTAGGYSGLPMETNTPLQGIRNRMAAGTEVIVARGAQIAAPRPNANNTNAQPTPVFNAAEELQKAVDAAKKADVAIVYVGTSLAIEAEGRDRTSLGLPGNQEELAKAVIAANPRTVIVLMNAGPLAIPGLAAVAPALIEAWWNGEQGANAMADVIFGNTNPGGKLPYTVYASAAQVPPQDEYDVTKGFTYLYLQEKPLFPFGHGLSYTDFKYANLKLASTQVKTSGKITVSVDVTNAGKMEGDEVVQLYVHEQKPAVKRPVKELRAFERITLRPGQTRTVTLSFPAEKLAFYDEAIHGFRVNPGAIDLMVGSSSEDIRARSQFTVTK